MSENTNIECPNCGQDSRAGATMCWSCDTPLGATTPTPDGRFDGQPVSLITCPKCGEPNPAGATMCRACYKPLGPIAIQRFEAQNAKQKRQAKRRKLADAAWMTSFSGGVLLAGASGYLPRRRFAVLGSGLLAASAPFIWVAWDNVRSKRKRTKVEAAGEANIEPVVRIANAMLFYGAKDSATRMRLRVGSLGMDFACEVGGEWRQAVVRTSFAIWPELKTHFRLLTNDWTRPVRFKVGEQGFCYTLQRERDYPHEALLWTREEVVFSPDELARLVELKN